MKAKVMVKIKGSQIIEGMSPEDVFDAGSRAENLPKKLKLIKLSPHDEILQNGTEIGVDLVVPKLPVSIPGLGNKLHIPAEVVECEPAKHMYITGDSDIATTALLLKLRELKGGKGTEIQHELEVTLNLEDMNSILKRLVQTALKVPLNLEISAFSDQHIANIVSYYDAMAVQLDEQKQEEELATVTPIRGKAAPKQPSLKKAASA